MELRSGRRLGSLPTPGPRRPPGRSDVGGSDWITALPDEMLLQILVRLRCARAAAHTSGLSRRWRGLWRHLPELSFRDISADAVDAALGQVACPALSRLEIDVPEEHRVMDPARVSALLRAAARLAPADLFFSLWGHCKDRDIPIEIPSFERATSVRLCADNLFLVPPAGGAGFPLLERLSVSGCCCFDMAELVLRCPRLRVLKVSGSATGTFKVHSPTIEKLVVEDNVWLSHIDIMAPVLKSFSLSAMIGGDYTVSFSAPMVETLWWYCSCDPKNVGFGDKWRLRHLSLNMSISAYFPVHLLSCFIPLTALEEVEITGFGGTDHEVDLLKLLFRCAALMKRITVVWDPEFSPAFRDCKEIYTVFEANPAVKCSVYGSPL